MVKPVAGNRQPPLGEGWGIFSWRNGEFSSGVDNSVTSALEDLKPSRIVLNMRALSSMDTAGLGQVMLLFSSAARQNCPLVIAGANSGIRQILRVTRMDGALILPMTMKRPSR